MSEIVRELMFVVSFSLSLQSYIVNFVFSSFLYDAVRKVVLKRKCKVVINSSTKTVKLIKHILVVKPTKQINMVPTMTCPATKALELQQHKTTTSKRSRQGSIDSKLSYELFNFHFDNNLNAFPVIEWDSKEDSDSLSDSSSVRSIESWNSLLIETECLLGKRGRSKPKSSYRRLVRSKKIKSDLASLARDISA